LKLISYNNASCDIDLNIDFYATASFGYCFLDIQFEIDEEIAAVFNFCDFMMKSKILSNGEEQSISNLITNTLWPYYQNDKLMKIVSDEKFMELNKTDWESIREALLDECGAIEFFAADSPTLSLSGSPGYSLIEDYENNLSMDGAWEDIGAHDKQVYHHTIHRHTHVLKEKHYFKELYSYIIEMQMNERTIRASSIFCSNWLARIGNKVVEIRKSIASNNDNTFYWKELKRNIELIDLNFLEFHTTVIRECLLNDEFPDTLSLDFTNEYKERYTKSLRNEKDSLFKALNEIKYAISNLATPGHTHDEHMLQSESEVTNERILLLSFLAMSIPMLGAIFSPNFTINTKIISATILFTLPIIYFIFRNTQKSFAYKRNIKTELKRQYMAMSSSLDKDKKRKKTLESIEDIPEDLRQSIMEITQDGIDATEIRLRKLEKKL